MMKYCMVKKLFKMIVISTIIFISSSCGRINPQKNIVSETPRYDWPHWRGSNGDGTSEETNWNPKALAEGPKVLWKTEIGFGYSNVAIKDCRLYTASVEGVYCLDAYTGKIIWKYPERFSEARATPAINGKYVYEMTPEGVVLCLKIKNGRLKWKKNIVSDFGVVKPYYSFAASPIIEGDLIILTGNISGIALNKNTGEIIWSSGKPPPSSKIRAYWRGQTTGSDYATPVIYDFGERRFTVISSSEGIHSIEVKTGNVRWKYEWELYRACQIAEPLVFDNKVFLTGVCFEDRKFGCVLLEVSGKEPEVLWKNNNLDSQISSPVLVGGYIFGCHGGPDLHLSELRCLDIKTGQIKWEKKLGNAMISFIVAGGKLIILEDNGTLHIAEASPVAYQEISSADVIGEEKKFIKFWTPPVLSNGMIYCRNYTGDLICIDVRK